MNCSSHFQQIRCQCSYCCISLSMFVCLYVCLLFTDRKAFSKTKGKNKSIQRKRRRTKEKRIEAIASFKKENKNRKTPQASCEQPNSIPLGNKQYTERRYYWGGSQKNKLQRQLQRSCPSSANNTKSVCAKKKGKKRTGRGERRETTETLFPRIIKQKSKK